MIETIEFKGQVYPKFQADGFAAQWAFPFAKKLCTGMGFDIGCNRVEWGLPDSIMIDPLLDIIRDEQSKFGTDEQYDAYKLPTEMPKYYANQMGNIVHSDAKQDITLIDYIFSSHCIEHLPDWVAALDYWATRLKEGGQLFLYLPDMSVQQYWQPWNNRKHMHFLEPKILHWYFESRKEMWNNVFVTGNDLNYSFYAIANKL